MYFLEVVLSGNCNYCLMRHGFRSWLMVVSCGDECFVHLVSVVTAFRRQRLDFSGIKRLQEIYYLVGVLCCP